MASLPTLAACTGLAQSRYAGERRLRRRHEPLAFGTSAAGVPRTYRIVPVKRRVVHAFLARSASGGGGLLNSVMVLVGDRLGLYKTGQYSSDADHPWR